jgi:tRNA-specific 2-thiouridylase
MLSFPHFTFDRRALFAKNVVGPFIEAYVAGETPSPCTTCNRTVKLAELFGIARKLGADYVATGHYARTEGGSLFAGRDANKDQSYFLYATPREMLEHLKFPLGESTKAEVRAEAVSRALPGAQKGESQELCFVGDGQGAYARFVEERARQRLRPGPIVDEAGRVIGSHDGIHRFTVGQRKGLGVATRATSEPPQFVTHIDAGAATVHVGSRDGLGATSAILRDVVLAPGVELPREALARIRYRHAGARDVVEAPASGSASVMVRFIEPVSAVSPGQVAVLYDGDRVLGGGIIADVTRSPELRS